PASVGCVDAAYQGGDRSDRRVDRPCHLPGAVQARPSRAAGQGAAARPFRTQACTASRHQRIPDLDILRYHGDADHQRRPALFRCIRRLYSVDGALVRSLVGAGVCMPARPRSLKIGGMPQLLRIFRPERLPTPPPRLDAVELLTLLAEARDLPGASLQPQQSSHDERRAWSKDARSATGGTDPQAAGSKRGNVTLNANPFVVAVAIALTAASAVLATDWLAVDTLHIHRIASGDAPVLDGDTSDPVWRSARPFSLMTDQGDNFDGRGESRVEIRAVHDDAWAYFLFTWEDPTRSLKQLPLIKKIDGWHVLHDGYERGDEVAFSEDKFAVLLTTSDADLAGDRTFHASSH